jgi:hypothetical protein
MATETSLWERELGWQINTGPDHVYREGAVRCAFKLVKTGDRDYVLTYDNDEMDAVWNNVKLTKRGGAGRPGWGNRKLDRWNQTLEYAYDKMINNYLLKVDTCTERLEGEIVVDDKHEAVTMFLCEDAVMEDELKPLLVIVLRTRFPWSQSRIALQQDGTAHAKPR